MLEVETFLDKSKIQGIGLFAKENISEGTIVWRCDERTTVKYTIEEWNELERTLPKTAFENIERFAYLRKGMWFLNLDDGRFMNHSKLPNLGYDKEKDLCYALFDIKEGEELTVLYSEFCDKSDTCKICGLCDN